MTISELFGSIGELLARIAFAFTRTFNLVTEGKLGDLVLSDLAMVAVVGGLWLVVGFMVVVVVFWWLVGLFEEAVRRPRDDD